MVNINSPIKITKRRLLFGLSFSLFLIFSIFFTNATVSDAVNPLEGALSDAQLMSRLNAHYSEVHDPIEIRGLFKAILAADYYYKSSLPYDPTGYYDNLIEKGERERDPAAVAIRGIMYLNGYKVALKIGDQIRAKAYASKTLSLAQSLQNYPDYLDGHLHRLEQLGRRQQVASPANHPLNFSPVKDFSNWGWGKYYPDSFRPEHVRVGGYTYFVDEPGCNPHSSPIGQKINYAYQPESYTTAYVTAFLMELYSQSRLDSAELKTFSNTLNLHLTLLGLTGFLARFGEDQYFSAKVIQTSDGLRGLYFNKTTGACEENYLIKNTNMLMGVALNLAYSIKYKYTDTEHSGSQFTYIDHLKKVADSVLFANNAEINNKNFGYYSYIHHSVDPTNQDPLRGSLKVKRALGHQVVVNGGNIECLSGSCLEHLPIEAAAYYKYGMKRNWWKLDSMGQYTTTGKGYAERIYKIITSFEKQIQDPRFKYSNIETTLQSAAVGYHCVARKLKYFPEFQTKGYVNIRQLCLNRTQILLNEIDRTKTLSTPVRMNVYLASVLLDID